MPLLDSLARTHTSQSKRCTDLESEAVAHLEGLRKQISEIEEGTQSIRQLQHWLSEMEHTVLPQLINAELVLDDLPPEQHEVSLISALYYDTYFIFILVLVFI